MLVILIAIIYLINGRKLQEIQIMNYHIMSFHGHVPDAQIKIFVLDRTKQVALL